MSITTRAVGNLYRTVFRIKYSGCYDDFDILNMTTWMGSLRWL